MAEISPSLLSGPARLIKTEMLLFSAAGSSEKIVENVEIPLSGWYFCNPTPFETVVKQLTTDKFRMRRGGCVVLQLVKETSLGGSWRRGGLSGRQGVEDVRSQGDLIRERRRSFVQESGKDV